MSGHESIKETMTNINTRKAIMKSISIDAIKEKMLESAKRFPVPMLFAFALSVVLIIMILCEDYHGVFVYYLTAGYMLSLMLELWGEAMTNKRIVNLVNMLSHAILFVDAFVLWLEEDSGFHNSVYIAHGAVYQALFLGIIFLSYYKEKDDVASWNFARVLLVNITLSLIIGVVMALCTIFLIYGCSSLFDLNLSQKWHAVTSVLFMDSLPMILILTRMPNGEERINRDIVISRFLNAVTRYLFIPLALCYVAVLTIYMFTIIFTWELPKGTLSWLVSILIFGIIMVEFLLYPTMRSNEVKKFEKTVMHFLPLISIPFVVLMTIGIIRRLSDYGITVNRLYILTLNIWFYIVCVGLYLTKARRIHWISLSFSAIMLLTSAQPYNFHELTKMHMTDYVAKQIEKHRPSKLPMNGNELRTWLASLPKGEKSKTYSCLQYLKEEYNDEATSQWINKSIWFSAWDEDVHDFGNDYVGDTPIDVYNFDQGNVVANFFCHNETYRIADGYKTFEETYGTYIDSTKNIINDSIATFKVATNADSQFVSINIRNVYKEEKECPICIVGDGSIAVEPKKFIVRSKGQMTEVQYNLILFRK